MNRSPTTTITSHIHGLRAAFPADASSHGPGLPPGPACSAATTGGSVVVAAGTGSLVVADGTGVPAVVGAGVPPSSGGWAAPGATRAPTGRSCPALAKAQ